MKRTIAMASAALLLLTSLAGCSAYNNPEKYVTLPDLNTITISQADIDEELKTQIDTLLDENRRGDYKEVNEAAKKGDQVNIDYEGKPTDSTLKLSDSTIAGMKAEKSDLVLGSDSFIGAYTKDGTKTHDGFEDQLIGKKAGDKVDVKVKFPDDYDTAELKGVEVVFTVTVNSVSRLTIEDKKTLIKVNYEFTPIEDEEEPTTDEEPVTDEAAGETENEAASQAEENDSAAKDEGATDTKGEGDSSPELDDKEEESKTKFTDLFKSSSFTIDYAKDADETKFNDIFKVSDYRSLFIGKNLYDEHEMEITVPTDVADKYKDYAGKNIKVSFTVSEATVLPEWNDDLVKEITAEAYTTVAAYEEALVESITIDLALVAVEEAAVYDGYPERETEKLYKQYVDQLVESTVGDSLDNLTASELKELITEADYEEIYASAAAQAMADVKSRLLVEYLCNELDIKLSSKEYDEELAKTFESYQADTSMMYYYYQYYGTIFTDAEQLETYFGKESLELQFKTSKMSEELIKIIKVVD